MELGFEEVTKSQTCYKLNRFLYRKDTKISHFFSSGRGYSRHDAFTKRASCLSQLPEKSEVNLAKEWQTLSC